LIGKRVGSYEVTAKLGEGGMGEVYRATDTKLKREVAIKVLPQEFTADKERLARFEREAQLLAQLNHPNIAQIYGLETSGETRALVMELVEGPTLAERLESGPLSLTESPSFALQIAQALAEAHEKGIVHRDLKPHNIKASSEGKIKILDFGLAKAMDSAVGAASAADVARSPTLMNSPTLTAAGTQLGMILGTAAYMAPEQARRRPGALFPSGPEPDGRTGGDGRHLYPRRAAQTLRGSHFRRTFDRHDDEFRCRPRRPLPGRPADIERAHGRTSHGRARLVRSPASGGAYPGEAMTPARCWITEIVAAIFPLHQT